MTTLLTTNWRSGSTVQSAPTTWSSSFNPTLAYDNFGKLQLDFHAAGTAPLKVLAVGAQSGSVTLGNGNDSFTWVAQSDGGSRSNNTMVVNTGAGNDTILITATGLSTLDDSHNIGDGSSWNSNYAGSYSVAELHLGAGKDTISVVGSTKLIMYGGIGFAVATGGSGSDTFNIGAGGGDLTGGGGHDTYVFQQGDGHVTIEDFTHNADVLNFVGIQQSDVHMTASTEHNVSGTLVTYDKAGDSVFLAHATNVTLSDMKFS
jgi:hypothetical protein